MVAANAVPEAQCSPKLLKQLDGEGEDKPEPAKLSMQQRQELLLATLKKDSGLDCLEEWPPKLAKKAVALLLEFHHIFSLEPNEIGCTDATKHVTELMKDEPFYMVSLSVFAGPERILRRFSVFTEEPHKSTINH